MKAIGELICFKPQEINSILQTNANTNTGTIILIVLASLGYLAMNIYPIFQLSPKERINKLLDLFPVFVILCAAIFLYINKPEVTIYG